MRIRRRSRVVVFRMDKDEYAALDKAQTDSKHLTISEYCRAAVMAKIKPPTIWEYAEEQGFKPTTKEALESMQGFFKSSAEVDEFLAGINSPKGRP